MFDLRARPSAANARAMNRAQPPRTSPPRSCAMKCYSLTHLADHVLLRDLSLLVTQDRQTTAAMLAHLAEVDARRLYAPAGYPSMYTYCVGKLRLSEDAAYKRIQAARSARRFPVLFGAVAEGRLNLNAVVLLTPHLQEGTADELLAAAEHKSRGELERLLAERFPRPDVPTRVQALSPAPAIGELAARQVESSNDPLAAPALELAPGPVVTPRIEPAPGQVVAPAAPARVAPLAPQRFALQLTIPESTHDKLRYAQALLGHAVPSGDLAQVLERALDGLIAKLEQRKLAAAARSRPGRSSKNPRYVPAVIRRAVWQRDQGQCTFVSAAGHRCEARRGIEFDHVNPVARGGQATTSGIRLRCRAHNQYAAECAFGSQFMRRKREAAQDRARESAEAREAESARAAATSQ